VEPAKIQKSVIQYESISSDDIIDKKSENHNNNNNDNNNKDDNLEIKNDEDVLQSHVDRAPRGQWLKKWSHPTSTTPQFIQHFESNDKQLQNTWNHVDKLRLIHAMLVRDGRRPAIKYLHNALEQWHKTTGNARDIYHCTVAYFWMQMVDFALATDKQEKSKAKKDDNGEKVESDSNVSNDNDQKLKKDTNTQSTSTENRLPTLEEFIQFIDKHTFLLNDQLHTQYYSQKLVLHDPTAFTSFVLPDIKPLPTIIVA